MITLHSRIPIIHKTTVDRCKDVDHLSLLMAQCLSEMDKVLKESGTELKLTDVYMTFKIG